MTRAFSLAGQMSAQLPQPMQSSVFTWMRKPRPLSSLPRAGMVSKPLGAALASVSSSRAGRMAACGQTTAHWLHWMQFSLSHCGTLMATPRFSYWLVATGKEPSGLKELTGRLSPFWARMGRMTFCTKAGTLSDLPDLSLAVAQAAGTLISTRLARVWSTPSTFILTILSPFLPYSFLMESFKSEMALSMGRTLASLKKAVCMIMLMRLPRPTAAAIFTASMV